MSPAVWAGQLGSGDLGVARRRRQERDDSKAMPGGKALLSARRGAVSPGTGRADARTTNRGFERSRWRRRLPRGFGERIRSGWRKAREPRIARRWAGRAGPGTRTGFACTSSAERYVGKAATASRWLLSTQIG